MKEKIVKILFPIVKEYNVETSDRFTIVPHLETIEDINSLLAEFYEKYKENLILYGGQAARADLLGLSRMRKHTNDIEYFTNKDDVIIDILKNNKVIYHTKYDILFFYKKNINITFSYKHIHDLLVPDDFINCSKKIKVKNKNVFCASSEYSIMLKMRRIYFCLINKKEPFGKDAIDIINMLVAPSFKNVATINFQKLSLKIKEYISKDVDIVQKILKFIDKYHVHLPKDFQESYTEIFSNLCQIVLLESE